MLKPRLKNYHENIISFDTLDKSLFKKKNFRPSKTLRTNYNALKIEGLVIKELLTGHKSKFTKQLHCNTFYANLRRDNFYLFSDTIIFKNINGVINKVQISFKIINILLISNVSTIDKDVNLRNQLSLKAGE